MKNPTERESQPSRRSRWEADARNTSAVPNIAAWAAPMQLSTASAPNKRRPRGDCTVGTSAEIGFQDVLRARQDDPQRRGEACWSSESNQPIDSAIDAPGGGLRGIGQRGNTSGRA